jgi:polysaccharide chain length determinant protein (PEP-CTERM system associated)
MNERTLHPTDYLVILQRRRWWFLGAFAACAIVGIALALLLPSVYRSGAMVAVQAPAVSQDVVSGHQGLGRDERLRALSQQLRSPAVLERVAREEGLTADRPLEEVVQQMVGRISVDVPKPIARSSGDPELNAFEIVYRDRTADGARRIANRLAQVFVDEHSRTQERVAEGTAEFMGRQIRDSQERIAKLEAKLRSVKELHMGKLPEQTPANLQTLAGVRQQLETTSNMLRSEQDRLSLLEREIQSIRQGLYSAPLGTPAAASSPQQRVVILQRQLADARAQYTDKHPEIQHLEEELKNARQQVAASQQSDGSRQELLSADPTYHQRVAERNLTQLRIRGLQRAEAQLRSDITRYQQRLEEAPMVEQELASTMREYEFERDNYKQLSERHASALVQEQIARTRGGERFSVLNPAYLPDSPESPNRARLLLVSLALGLVLGAAMAFGREYFDRSIRDARTLQDEFDVPVLAEIPRIDTAA